MVTETGGCLCGHIKFEYDTRHQGFIVCHCTDCQRATGSPMAPITMVAKDAFRLTSGELNGYTNELHVSRYFCPTCGSPFLSEVERIPDLCFIKTGALDIQPAEPPSMRCWTRSAPQWLDMAEAEAMFEVNPPM